MVRKLPADVEAQLREHMATGLYASEEDVLRAALRVLKHQDEDVAAIREAITDMEAGDRGRPFDEYVNEFRAKHNIPHDA